MFEGVFRAIGNLMGQKKEAEDPAPFDLESLRPDQDLSSQELTFPADIASKVRNKAEAKVISYLQLIPSELANGNHSSDAAYAIRKMTIKPAVREAESVRPVAETVIQHCLNTGDAYIAKMLSEKFAFEADRLSEMVSDGIDACIKNLDSSGATWVANHFKYPKETFAEKVTTGANSAIEREKVVEAVDFVKGIRETHHHQYRTDRVVVDPRHFAKFKAGMIELLEEGKSFKVLSIFSHFEVDGLKQDKDVRHAAITCLEKVTAKDHHRGYRTFIAALSLEPDMLTTPKLKENAANIAAGILAQPQSAGYLIAEAKRALEDFQATCSKEQLLASLKTFALGRRSGKQVGHEYDANQLFDIVDAFDMKPEDFVSEAGQQVGKAFLVSVFGYEHSRLRYPLDVPKVAERLSLTDASIRQAGMEAAGKLLGEVHNGNGSIGRLREVVKECKLPDEALDPRNALFSILPNYAQKLIVTFEVKSFEELIHLKDESALYFVELAKTPDQDPQINPENVEIVRGLYLHPEDAEELLAAEVDLAALHRDGNFEGAWRAMRKHCSFWNWRDFGGLTEPAIKHFGAEFVLKYFNDARLKADVSRMDLAGDAGVLAEFAKASGLDNEKFAEQILDPMLVDDSKIGIYRSRAPYYFHEAVLNTGGLFELIENYGTESVPEALQAVEAELKGEFSSRDRIVSSWDNLIRFTERFREVFEQVHRGHMAPSRRSIFERNQVPQEIVDAALGRG